ncbi:MAG TPA: S8 family serine peptidase, partial [Blastocatellia bacterium]|nr:S8 family serine peptidase [Blastocatellia bacterium]
MKNFPRELKHGMGAMMTLDLTRLLLAFKGPQARNEVETLLKRLDLVLEDDLAGREQRLPRPMYTINHTNQRFWVRSQSGKPIDQQHYDNIEHALGDRLAWIGPVYRPSNTEGRAGLLCPLPNVLVIKPAGGQIAENGRSISSRLSRVGLKEVPEKSKYLTGYRYFVITNPKEQTAYQLRSTLFEKEKQNLQDARFENMPMIVPTTVVPNDPLFAQQWDMTQIHAGGPGTTGWDISTGVNSVVVCVLDEGCDLTHPDLTPFASPGINLGTMMPDGSPTGDHGTACAGIVAGRFNTALGVAGVAGNCQILPVAFQNWT